MTAERNVENRRGAYRVRPESIHELDIAVLEKRYRVVRGKVADVAIGGAQAQFDKDVLETVSEGERIMLALASERYNFDRTLWARIVASVVDDAERTLSFSFEQDNDPLSPESELFFELFNRRAKYRRIEAGTESALGASVSPRAQGDAALHSQPVSIRDISGVGVSFAVDAQADGALRSHDDLSLRLMLPGHRAPQTIYCQVRHRSRHGDDIYYGCEFDWSADAKSLALAEELVAYVREHFEEDNRLAPDRRNVSP